MKTRRDAIARLRPLQPIKRAVEKASDAGARFPQSPFEERIVPTRGDQRSLRFGRSRRPRRDLCVAGHAIDPQPLRDFVTRKQQLARHPAERQRLLGDKVIDLAFLHPQKGG
jgi:hypothetical protein